MIYWDSRMREAQLEHRLQSLTVVRGAGFALGCAVHVHDRIASSSERPGEVFAAVADLLERFWNHYPQSVQSNIAHELAGNAAAVVPEEDTPPPLPGEGELAWATAYGLSAATRPSVDKESQGEIFASIDQSYQAVLRFFNERDHTYGSDEQIRAIEESSEVCRSEILFQLSFFAAVETAAEEPPSLPYMMRHIRG